MNSVSSAIIKSSGLHLAAGVLLVSSVHFTPEVQQQTPLNIQAIEAVVIDESVVVEQLQRIEDKKQAEKQRVENERQRRQREANAAAAAKKEKQRREKEEADRLKRERIKKEKERKAAEEKKKKEEEERKKEAERKRKEDERKKQEAQERAEQERLMNEQLQKEQASRNKVRQREVLSEVQKYELLVNQTIQRNWNKEDYMKGKFCRLNVRLATNGLVTQVTVLEGDDIVCRSAQAAVYKANTLPVSEDPEVFAQFRSFNLKLVP